MPTHAEFCASIMKYLIAVMSQGGGEHIMSPDQSPDGREYCINWSVHDDCLTANIFVCDGDEEKDLSFYIEVK